MLTDLQCKRAECPEGKPRARFSDDGGLYLEVAPSGSKRWFWKFYADGKEKRLVSSKGSQLASELQKCRGRCAKPDTPMSEEFEG